MNNRGGRMKRDKIKIIIIYILMFVIFALVGYLIYFIVNTNKETEKTETKQQIQKTDETSISDSCTFSVTLNELDSLEQNRSAISMCEGYNKLVVNNITLNSQPQDVYLIYYNGTQSKNNNKLGLYINNKQVTNGASYDIINVLGVSDNLLFVKTLRQEGSFLRIFNAQGQKVYDLETALAKAKVEDPALIEIAKTDQTISTIINTKNINPNSFNFTSGTFTFNVEAKQECTQGQIYKGSTYKVTYNGETFENPTFVSYINC